MKKLLILLMTLFCCATAFAADADKKPATQDGMNWEISMMPKPSEEEQEPARWSIVVENNVGIYAYDMNDIFLRQLLQRVIIGLHSGGNLLCQAQLDKIAFRINHHRGNFRLGDFFGNTYRCSNRILFALVYGIRTSVGYNNQNRLQLAVTLVHHCQRLQ